MITYVNSIDGDVYWSNADRADELNEVGPQKGFFEFAYKVVDRLKYKLKFYVIDLARTAEGNWILVEVNDGQMSGLSMNDPEVIYSNLRKALDGELINGRIKTTIG